MEQLTIKNGFTGILTSIGIIAGVAFFAYAALQGEYGMFRLFQVQAQESRLLAELEILVETHDQLKNRTLRLSNDYLDLDLLDEQARKVLGLARGDEIVIR
ncbi:MAG: septum formation initiator family protein [Rhodobacteraceae bacterium]|nr:septum formation initiator family protein [Paracoccaceae bacterium]